MIGAIGARGSIRVRLGDVGEGTAESSRVYMKFLRYTSNTVVRSGRVLARRAIFLISFSFTLAFQNRGYRIGITQTLNEGRIQDVKMKLLQYRV